MQRCAETQAAGGLGPVASLQVAKQSSPTLPRPGQATRLDAGLWKGPELGRARAGRGHPGAAGTADGGAKRLCSQRYEALSL